MPLSIVNSFFSGHAPFPSRGNNLEIRGQGVNTYLKPHLVIALAGTTMSYG